MTEKTREIGASDDKYERMASEWLRAIRGSRSQTAFRRRLKYKSNVVYLWESGRNFPTASMALYAASRTGIDVGEALRGLFRNPPVWTTELDPLDPKTIAELLNELRGAASITQLAHRSGLSRFVVARCLKGQTEPRLPDFFRLIEAASLRLLDFIARFVDPSALPSVALQWKQLEAARHLATEQPWAAAVLLALEVKGYRSLPKHVPGWIASRLGIDTRQEDEALRLLEQSGQVFRHKAGKYSVREEQVVHTPASADARDSPKHWWARVAADRFLGPHEGAFSYNLFSISEDGFRRLQTLQKQYYRSMRAMINESGEADRVVLANLQLLALDKAPD